METIRKFLVAQLGEDCLQSREVFDLKLPEGNKQLDAQFDPYNERLKLFNVNGRDFRKSGIVEALTDPKSISRAYTKLTVYAKSDEKSIWHALGFSYEGSILGFFENGSNTYIWATYSDYERESLSRQADFTKIVESARSKRHIRPSLKKGYSSDIATEKDATAISKLLKRTFNDYPAKISSKRIRSLIKNENSVFRTMRDPDGNLVAVASAEIDHKRSNAELTDCATVEDERRKGHMAYILNKLVEDVEEKYGVTNFYSLTRAGEPGINYTFAMLGYIYTGRLFNNCRMPDGWESMNIWCRPPDET